MIVGLAVSRVSDTVTGTGKTSSMNSDQAVLLCEVHCDSPQFDVEKAHIGITVLSVFLLAYVEMLGCQKQNTFLWFF